MWPPGLRDSKGGKKADILKLVRRIQILLKQPFLNFLSRECLSYVWLKESPRSPFLQLFLNTFQQVLKTFWESELYRASLLTSSYMSFSRCLDRNEFHRYPAHELLTHPFISPSPSTHPYSFMPSSALASTKPMQDTPTALTGKLNKNLQSNLKLILIQAFIHSLNSVNLWLGLLVGVVLLQWVGSLD